MAVAGEGGADRRLPAVAPLRHWRLHTAVPDACAGHAQRGPRPDSAGHAYHGGGTDTRHGALPRAEGRAGARGHDAEPRDGLSRQRRGVRPAARRTWMDARRHGNEARDVRRGCNIYLTFANIQTKLTFFVSPIFYTHTCIS